MGNKSRHTPLLQGLSPFDVDFVIPRIGVDLPLGIDPFLLFKSRDPILKDQHHSLLEAFNTGIAVLRQGDPVTARHLLNFPEVPEIGLGYSRRGKRGSGVGPLLTELIIETLLDSPLLMERGVQHVEEMQLVAVNIGPDRTSDIAANLIKGFLIRYTQEQCELWKIPVKSGVPVSHIYDPVRLEWYDDYVDLPVSPFDSDPMIFVPRRLVRTLPWINYNDFFRMEFSAFLRKKRAKARLRQRGKTFENQWPKERVVAVTRAEVERIDRYILAKERRAEQAQPTLSYLDEDDRCLEASALKDRLSKIAPGQADASTFQRLVLEILNYLFNPELIDGTIEAPTYHRTERRDIIFTNDSDQSFWDYVRNEHSSFLLMFEAKNTHELEPGHFNQTATYLGDRLGRLGFIITRNEATTANLQKAFAIYNDSQPRKIILTLCDNDLNRMLDMKCAGNNPADFIQKTYRKFRTSVQ